MRKRNNLSAFKSENKRVLEPTPAAKTRQIGRPKKLPLEKRSQKVLLSFTIGEEQQIREKAGLVPVATYITAVLREHNIID